jgi:[ribosomal protein S18]-alanine N-acetyltransferase
MPRVTIERMLPEDVPAVMAVDHLCFPTPWSENAYRSELGNVSAYYLIARLPWRGFGTGAGDRGRLVGFAGAWIVMDEAHITTIGVHPDYRRHGIGERLLTALLEEARERGVRRATLEVRETNRGAQALYARFGFMPIARRRRYYSDTDEDAIVMWVDDLQSGVGGQGSEVRRTSWSSGDPLASASAFLTPDP